MRFTLYHGTRANPDSIRKHGLVAGGLENYGSPVVNKINTLMKVLDEFGLAIEDVPESIYEGELTYEQNRPVHVHLETSFDNAKGYAHMGGEPAYIFRRGILAWWAGMLLGDTETVLHAIDRKLHDEVNEYAMKRNGDNSYVVVVEIDTDDLLLDDESAKRLIRMYEASKRFPDQDVMSGPCEIRYNGTITPDQIKGIIQVVHTGL